MKKSTKKSKAIIPFAGAFIAIAVGVMVVLNGNKPKSDPVPEISGPIEQTTLPAAALSVVAGETKQLTLAIQPESAPQNLPGFLKLTGNILEAKPGKYDAGEHKLTFAAAGRQQDATVTVTRAAIDWAALGNEVKALLGSKQKNYGIWIEDLLYKEHFELNPTEVYLPGSMAKLPVIILTLRDIDAGKFKFDDTYPVKNKNKHSNSDSIGRLAEGTPVKIKDYIYYTIHESNNSAMYSMRDMIGGVDIVDQRTKVELGAYTYHDAPGHIAMPVDVATVIKGLYEGKFLSKANTDYLLDLMKNTLPSMREAIPAGIPDKSLPVANKVGFLNTKDGTAYGDLAIVYGKTTDYLIIVLDRSVTWEEGRTNAKKIAGIAYKYLN
jgi:hypothetical protein